MAEPAESVFTTNDEPQVEQPKTSLDDWVGEGKKFATVEQLVDSYGHSQSHISNLERTQGELREDLTKRKTIEELYDQLQPQTTQTTTEESTGSTDFESQLTQDQIAQLIADKTKEGTQGYLTEFEQRLNGDNNEREVDRVLKDRFGAASNKMVQDKASELGKSLADLKDMARTDPKLFVALFHSGGTASATHTSSVNMDQPEMSGSSKPVRNYAHYEKLRKENPGEYYKPAVQRALLEDAGNFGSDFYN